MKNMPIIVALTGLFVSGMSSAIFAETSIVDAPVGHSQGNHRLDCTVVRPWGLSGSPTGPYPVIGWANGWGQGNVFGAGSTDHYISGLEYWSDNGDFIIIAANQWSARSPDLTQCLQWLIDANYDDQSDYYGLVDTANIGVAGHSQGGGAALKTGDPILMDNGGYTQVSTVVAMNPYGPSWVKAKAHNGQIMVLGGDSDVVTPTDSFSQILDDIILDENPGGVQAELIDGDHCIDACLPGFGNNYGPVSLLWFQIMLTSGNDAAFCNNLIALLEGGNWTTTYSANFNLVCP